MKKLSMIFSALLLVSPVAAQELITAPEGYIMPRIPDEAEKKAALLMAYELNGNSMVRMGSIDLTAPPPKPIATVPITPDSSIAPPKKATR